MTDKLTAEESYTGAYVRVQDEQGKWASKGIDRLTDAQLEAFALAHPEDGWKWAKFLAAWIRNNIL